MPNNQKFVQRAHYKMAATTMNEPQKVYKQSSDHVSAVYIFMCLFVVCVQIYVALSVLLYECKLFLFQNFLKPFNIRYLKG